MHCDFLTEEPEKNKITQEDVPGILQKYNLLVNKDKTENTILNREERKRSMEKSHQVRINARR